MPSGKKSKQARRAAASAPPPVRSKGTPGRRQADPKLLAIGGGVIALIAVIVVLVVVLTGGGSSNNTAFKDLPAVGSCATGLPGCGDVAALYKGIPQQGNVLGKPSAPVTMVEYIDLQCPFCQQFETTVFPNILSKYVRTGKVKVEVRTLDFIGPDSSRGRNAMIAAGKQNKAFNFAELMYFNQKTENTGWLNDAMVGQVAASIPGLKVQQLLSDRNSGAVKSTAREYDRQQAADQVTGTPTLFVGKSGAKKLKQVALASSTDQQSLVDAIDAALAS